MTIHKALHPKDDIDRLYVAKKKGEEDKNQDYVKKAWRKTGYCHQKQ